MHPALQFKVMIVEGYHYSESCWDTPLPIHGWPPTVQYGVEMAPSQASPSGWIYQAALYNTQGRGRLIMFFTFIEGAQELM